jgi:predicted 3-demethylubiquinone-9 3-methyltransferase (glyoxalase superfamily)
MPTLHSSLPRISPCLWFDDQAEQAAQFYTSVFPHSRIVTVARYGEAGTDIHGRPPGSVMTVAFELDGQAFTALNGGPVFTFNEAISFQVYCDSQQEIDHFWNNLREGGPQHAQQCGWLKDRYGASWQIVPRTLVEMMSSGDQVRADRVMTAMLGMKKLDLAKLQAAYDG